jgi:hypothetical protein
MSDFKLDSRPNIKSGFKVPDSYFESLTERIMLNIPMEEVKVIPLYRRRPVWITSAAAALVLSLSLVVSKNATAAPAAPDQAASKDYILNNVSSYTLTENIDLNDLDDETVNAISDEVIEDFVDFDDVSNQIN